MEVVCLKGKKYMGKINGYLRGSYGIDQLSKYLYITGLLLSLSRFSSTIGFILIVYGTWRCLSKDKPRRYKELLSFENFLRNVKSKYYKSKTSITEYRHYKVFKCPNCSQKLRVPRKKGKLLIGCKKCDTVFRGKS